jgi:mannonate dehydratase
MKKHTRRKWMKNNIAITAGTGAALGMSIMNAPHAMSRSAVKESKGNIKLAWALERNPLRLRLAKQIGVNHVIARVTDDLKKTNRDQYYNLLKKIKGDYEAAGFTVAGVESDPVKTDCIKLGISGRDEEIANYIAAIEAMGKVGIPMCCYNFMAGIGWYRTRFDIPERGGALTSEFNYQDAEQQGLTEFGRISEEQIWDNITYFLQKIIPVAEKANVKMALHPDDPPISPLRGVGRIITSADAFRRVMSIVPSPVNGIAFCQANFKAMGEDIESVAKEFCEQGKVFFIHFRDIEGTGERFRETFHDNGPTDMARILQVYYESGFDGPIRPDHAPTLEGENKESNGYGMVGKVFAVGYMKGLMESLSIPYQ